MKLGILQPYCFPYLGYLQLINAVDKLVFLDTVQFSRPTWVNRNFLADRNGPVPFRFPVQHATSKTCIHDIQLADPERYQSRFLKTLQAVYGGSPHFDRGYATVEKAFSGAGETAADLAINSLMAMAEAFSISTPMVRAKERYPDQPGGAENLVIHICKREQAEIYYNPIGGQRLYRPHVFRQSGLKLKFLRCLNRTYPRGAMPFYPNLSALDALMFCSESELAGLLLDCDVFETEEDATDG